MDAVVAGHICLDITPRIAGAARSLQSILVPGSVVLVNGSTLSTGGPVANTGGAMHALGCRVELAGKVGDDLYGRALLGLLATKSLDGGMTVVPGESTSFSVVLAAPGHDRLFLHDPGANDTFTADNVPWARVRASRLFHFGYPPVMRRMYESGGDELVRLLRAARETGATVSMDMAMPDPSAASGRAPWAAILQRALGLVDVFAPSLDELLYMIDPAAFERLGAMGGERSDHVTPELLGSMAQKLIEWGAGVVLIKCGVRGAYLRSASRSRLAGAGRALSPLAEKWADLELKQSSFRADGFVNATGAGDACIAGFLSALLDGSGAAESLELACAAGALSTQASDCCSALRPLAEIQRVVRNGWARNASW